MLLTCPRFSGFLSIRRILRSPIEAQSFDGNYRPKHTNHARLLMATKSLTVLLGCIAPLICELCSIY